MTGTGVLGSRELMERHIEALFTRDESDRLVSVNEPGGGPAPRFFLGRTAEGPVWAVRHDQPEDLARRLSSMTTGLAPIGPDATAPGSWAPFLALLSERAPVERIWEGPAYSFPEDVPAAEETVEVTSMNADILRPFLPEWIGDVSADVPMCAALVDGRAVSVCCSVRLTEHAHEAGVETHPDFRGEGCAVRAVAGWARLVRAAGVTPLYSTSWENGASRRVAEKLGLIRFGADLHVT